MQQVNNPQYRMKKNEASANPCVRTRDCNISLDRADWRGNHLNHHHENHDHHQEQETSQGRQEKGQKEEQHREHFDSSAEVRRETTTRGGAMPPFFLPAPGDAISIRSAALPPDPGEPPSLPGT